MWRMSWSTCLFRCVTGCTWISHSPRRCLGGGFSMMWMTSFLIQDLLNGSVQYCSIHSLWSSQRFRIKGVFLKRLPPLCPVHCRQRYVTQRHMEYVPNIALGVSQQQDARTGSGIWARSVLFATDSSNMISPGICVRCRARSALSSSAIARNLNGWKTFWTGHCALGSHCTLFLFA